MMLCGVVQWLSVHKIMWNVDPSSILRYTLAGSFRMRMRPGTPTQEWTRGWMRVRVRVWMSVGAGGGRGMVEQQAREYLLRVSTRVFSPRSLAWVSCRAASG